MKSCGFDTSVQEAEGAFNGEALSIGRKFDDQVQEVRDELHAAEPTASDR